MRAEGRRQAICENLEQSKQPISATALAGQFGVSRQVIVGDIALLRASGAKITATPRGYVILGEDTCPVRQIACQHDGAQIREELYAIVDQGCTVLDVTVEHPIYGELTGPLQVKNRHEVDEFVRRVEEADALPLSHLTEGIHLHALSCPDDDAFRRVTEELRRLHILLTD